MISSLWTYFRRSTLLLMLSYYEDENQSIFYKDNKKPKQTFTWQ